MGINKWVQERCYTVLSRRWGMGACVAVAVAALNLALLALSLPFLLSHRGGKVDSFYPAFPCGAPVDIVYTWVNGSDPLHIQLLQEYKQRAIIAKSNLSAINASQGLPSDVAGQSRFVDNEELRYSLRSVEKFAPWVNHIYLVTNGQIPYWLDLNNPKLSLVTHEEIFLNQSHLPTFSSPAIEAHLHRIPHLAPDFIYLNDDVMFGAPIWPSTFTSEADGQRVFLAWPVPPCAEGCSATWLGDGYCDRSCNVSACEYDGGDCLNTTQTVPSWWATNTKTDDRYSKYCTRSCPDSWVGDTFCDKMCNVADCGFDGGDCGVDSIFSTMMGWSARNSQTYIVPDETLAVYFNLSTPSGSVNFSVTEGNHNNPVLVRTAVITKKYGVMVVLFNKNQTRDN
ncbi:N-acetylglucosamine-1-phosphate transferase [Pelomyxa schiedti]|nr:N-acetylglucosamine-1-phosphate transferase [Pelomyxa schiedti]